MFLLLGMVVTERAISCLLLLERRWEFSLCIRWEPITVAKSGPEVAHASPSDHSLIKGWLHSVLECLPTSVVWVTKLTIVRLELHVFRFSLHAHWFRRISLVLWGTLNIIDIFFLSLLQDLAELLPKHFFSACTKLSCMTCTIIERFLLHYNKD